MKLKVQNVFEATLVLSQIIRENRPMPQKGAYRLARLHAKLQPEFNTISEQRDKLIIAYDYKAKPKNPDTGKVIEDAPEQNMVPDDKMAEFLEAWKKISEETIEVEVQPVPLWQLDRGADKPAAISASELITLGDLVNDDDPPALAKAA